MHNPLETRNGVRDSAAPLLPLAGVRHPVLAKLAVAAAPPGEELPRDMCQTRIYARRRTVPLAAAPRAGTCGAGIKRLHSRQTAESRRLGPKARPQDAPRGLTLAGRGQNDDAAPLCVRTPCGRSVAMSGAATLH